MFCIEAVGFHQFGGLAALTEEIVHGYYLDGAGGVAGQYSGDQLSKASGNQVLLGCNHRSGLGGGSEHSLRIQGLDGVYVNNFCRDSLFFQLLGCKEGLPYQVAGGEDGHILSFDQFQGFPYLEYLVFGSEIGYGGTAEAEINGSFVGGSRNGRGLGTWS